MWTQDNEQGGEKKNALCIHKHHLCGLRSHTTSNRYTNKPELWLLNVILYITFIKQRIQTLVSRNTAHKIVGLYQ